MSEKDVTVVLANLPAALPELEAVYSVVCLLIFA